MELKISIEGHREGDLESALQEVLKKVKEGYTSGADSNDTGGFHFEIHGSPVEKYAVAKNSDAKKLSTKRYDHFDEASADANDGDTVVGLRDDGEVLIIT